MLSFASLFLQVKSNKVKKNRMTKGVNQIMADKSTKDVVIITEKAYFSTHHVDILCTKRVDNVVEI